MRTCVYGPHHSQECVGKGICTERTEHGRVIWKGWEGQGQGQRLGQGEGSGRAGGTGVRELLRILK